MGEATAAKPEKWVYIDNGSWHTGEEMKAITDSMGNLPIFISTQYEGNKNPGCITYNKDTATYTTDKTKCTSRSLLDVIKRTNELGNFLGISKVDIAKDQQEFCEASQALTEAASNAQQRGIRVMTVNPSIDENNAVSLYFVDPLTDPFLRSYEELGVPIIHPGLMSMKSHDWFTDCPPATMFQNCNSNTYYPVDLYLVEGRRFFFNTPEEQYFLQSFFPDKALLSNQVAHWPLNDGPISYTSAARSFKDMARKLNEAVRLHDTTTCTKVDVSSELFLDSRFGGLQNGQYACYDHSIIQSAYIQCNAADLAAGKQMETTVDTTSTETQFVPKVSTTSSLSKSMKKQVTRTQWNEEKKNVHKQKRSSNQSNLLWIFITVSL